MERLETSVSVVRVPNTLVLLIFNYLDIKCYNGITSVVSFN